MADQINLMDITIPEATTPTNGYLYIVIDNIDYRIPYANLVQFLKNKSTIRAAGNVAVTTGSNTINFELDGVETPFSSANYSLIVWSDVEGTIKPDSYDENGFVIIALEDSNIHYQAILNT